MTASLITSLQVGQRVRAAEAFLRESQTKPPPRFTDGSLIEAMTNVDKFVDDPNDKRVLKDAKGIGTERTRNVIIDTLVRRDFLSRKGKQIISTPEGRELVKQLSPQLTNPATTAKWEMAFSLIEEGRATLEQFMQRQERFVAGLVEEAKNAQFDKLGGGPDTGPVAPMDGDGGACPECGSGVLQTRVVRNEKSKAYGKRFLGCNRHPKCDYTKWED